MRATPTTWALLAILAAAGCDKMGGLTLRPDAQTTGGEDRYTILLYTFTGPDHAAQAQRWKENTTSHAGWKNLRVVHEDGASLLYWGDYPSVKAAEPDVRKAHAYKAPNGEAIYSRAIAGPMPGSNFGPPEWDLLSSRGVYTVLIGVYFDVPEKNYVGRKKFAVETVRQLRQQGYEAYYFHGPVRSHVSVGSFPLESVETLSDGTSLRRVVKDERINAILKQFPNLSVNGAGVREAVGFELDPATRQPKMDPATRQPIKVFEDAKSYVAEVPGRLKPPTQRTRLEGFESALPH
jgi:hypothetical protein